MRENYSKELIKRHFFSMLFITILIAARPVIARSMYEETLQCSLIRACLIVILGVVVALLVALCHMKAAKQLENIGAKSEKDYVSEVYRINLKHHTCIAFIGMIEVFLLIEVISFGRDNDNTWMFLSGFYMYVIFTLSAIIIAVAITYIYYKIRLFKTMKENYYSKEKLEIRVGILLFCTFFFPTALAYIRNIYEEPLQCILIKLGVIFIMGLVATLLIALCDMKAARQLEEIEYQSEKEYASKVSCINIKHNIFIGFILMNVLYLWETITSYGIEDMVMFKYDISMHVIVTASAMLITAGITYLYFKIRSLSNNRQ